MRELLASVVIVIAFGCVVYVAAGFGPGVGIAATLAGLAGAALGLNAWMRRRDKGGE